MRSAEEFEHISAEEFQGNFDLYLERVEGGESFVITRSGEDLAVLIPYTDYVEITDIIDDVDTRV